MKTFVFLAGLMVLVPRTDPRGEWQELTVLVLDVEASAKPGEVPHHHVTTVTNFGGTYNEQLQGEWTLQSGTKGPMELVGDDRYLVLERIYGSGARLPPMQEACYAAGATSNCKNIENNKNLLVKAVLTFKGAWRIRPVEVTHDREPRGLIYDDSRWGFLPFPVNKLVPQSAPADVQLSAGLMLEPVDDPKTNAPGTATILDPGKKPIESPYPLRPQVCQLFAGYPGHCGVVRFLNVMHAMSFEHDDQVIDFTQDMIYDLFRDKEQQLEPAVRYLTVLRKDARPEVMDVLYPGGGGSPFPRPCPPPTFAPPVVIP